MEVHDYVRILQARWKIIAVVTIVAVLAALTVSLLTTPQYEAKTRLFVSTTSGASVQEIYQGNLFSQQRVASYTELLAGTTLAQRALDELGITDMTPGELAARVTASSTPDTVLIDTALTDESPERARDLANALSDEFVVMARELETPESGGEPTARVVVEQYAATPSTPVVPKTSRNVALGLAVGLLLGIALAVLRDRLDNTVKDRNTIEEIAGTGVVGVIPMEKARHEEPAITFADSNSGDAEAYRELRTNLQFLEVDNPPRVLVFTSSVPTEGKTTTAINTALVLAEAGKPVVLVEADLRRPRVSKYLGVLGDAGLSTVLAHQASLDAVLQSTRFDSLWVLAAGALPPNPSELLGSAQTEEVVTDLRSRFDYVVIDAPPLLPVTDAAILTRIADGALLIARYGKTTRDQFGRAIGNLKAVDATLLGTILTMVPTKGRGASYEYRYYYDAERTHAAGAAPKQAVENPAVPGPAIDPPAPPRHALGNGRKLTGPVAPAGRHSEENHQPLESWPAVHTPPRPATGSAPDSGEQG
ncbi:MULTISPECIES: polysaccharide biosynthesis tyrosine autokinase [unclassified Rhodococcus (in: high G+C Gram-positive bacteria)]|uniref:polysaccharide biosynthesis tyrosine autokinase n=1 Tax=unclassified Rhodococcus (in: high G+C Gram-positive bacteria) TaxID=192944 RepID=UPI00146B5224|nr:polysaccharide biosynthesis tyrosine autokinase [Rhodococcus sp. 105337]NME77903.1 polysaccharide biosynthesis tyrosine autokinase [Rhodococcus sp. 105337]